MGRIILGVCNSMFPILVVSRGKYPTVTISFLQTGHETLANCGQSSRSSGCLLRLFRSHSEESYVDAQAVADCKEFLKLSKSPRKKESEVNRHDDG